MRLYRSKESGKWYAVVAFDYPGLKAIINKGGCYNAWGDQRAKKPASPDEYKVYLERGEYDHKKPIYKWADLNSDYYALFIIDAPSDALENDFGEVAL